jgi:FkbM family methyltransferase
MPQAATQPECTTPVTLGSHRVVIAGDPDDHYVTALADFAGKLAPLARYLERTLPPAPLCLDVGANIGLTAILMALTRPAGEIIAFEASPRNAHWLRHNLAHNGIANCTVVETAVGAHEGHAVFRQTPFAAASHVVRGDPNAPPHATTRVPITSLDRYLTGAAQRAIDFIKLDVEGFEPPVLAGAAATLARHRCPLYMEFNAWCLLIYQNFNPLALAASLIERFDLARLDADGCAVALDSPSVAHFMKEILIDQRCVDDILIRLKPGARIAPLDEMTKCADDLDAVRALRRLQAGAPAAMPAGEAPV